MTSTTIYSVYKITNTVNNKIYIGKTSKSAEERFKRHIVSAKVKQWSHLKLYRAFSKYGVDKFVVETIYQSYDKNHINDIEDKFIQESNSMSDNYGYNMCPGGQGGDIKSLEQKLLDAERSRKRNAIRYECEYCKGLFDRRNLDRWHNKNCLSNPNADLTLRKQVPISEQTRKNQSVAQLALKKKLSPKLKEEIGKRSKERIANMSKDELDRHMCHMRAQKTCPHCSIITTAGNYGRWHGTKCKHQAAIV